MSSDPHFLVPELPASGPFVLDGEEGRHAAAVRRLRPGESLVLTDGRGGRAPAEVTAAARDRLTVLVGPAQRIPAPDLRVVLVQAIAKGDRSELAVELATEAGVDAIVPWAAERCVARWVGAEKVSRGRARWQAAATQAAKQARRTWTPAVAPVVGMDGLLALVAGAAAAIVLHEHDAVGLTAVALPAAGDLVMVVGPEGGIAPAELASLRAAGARPVRLGPEVLRTSTAAAVALGALGVLTKRWAVPDAHA